MTKAIEIIPVERIPGEVGYVAVRNCGGAYDFMAACEKLWDGKISLGAPNSTAWYIAPARTQKFVAYAKAQGFEVRVGASQLASRRQVAEYEALVLAA